MKGAATLVASQLASTLNSYTIRQGPPRTIIVPNATELSKLAEVTVKGTLLRKQRVKLDPTTSQRSVEVSKKAYHVETGDGDLHFCLGGPQDRPHIACELQSAKPWLNKFKQSVGKSITVSGFFRCMFEHPGFRSNDDAHIFEIHPVRAVSLDGQILSFDVDIPDQDAIHTWRKPYDLNKQDGRIGVHYDKRKDTLTFQGMAGRDENYLRITGVISKVNSQSSTTPSSFTFTSPDIGHAVQTYCLGGTSADRQLRRLKKGKATMVALRNIDLSEALNNRYTINLLAIDIRTP